MIRIYLRPPELPRLDEMPPHYFHLDAETDYDDWCHLLRAMRSRRATRYAITPTDGRRHCIYLGYMNYLMRLAEDR